MHNVLRDTTLSDIKNTNENKTLQPTYYKTSPQNIEACRLKKDIAELEEKFDVESITVNMLE